jgi:hypothetical protein
MIQTSNTPFYKASKYKCSSHAFWHTPTSTYNSCIERYLKIKTTSELFLLPKKYIKHQVIPSSTKNLFSSNKSAKVPCSEPSLRLPNKKQQAVSNRLNNSNYNSYSPLSDEETIYHQKHQPNMANKLARLNFRTMLSNANNVARASTPSENTTNNIQPTTANINQADTQTQDSPTTLSDNSPKRANTNVILQLESKDYAPKNLTMAPFKTIVYDKFNDNKDTCFSLVVRIGQKKTEQLQFHEGRILTAILTSFQHVMPLIRIVPFRKQRVNVSDVITSPDDIIFDQEYYSKFMEHPTYTKNRQLVFRLHFVAKKPFFWYKKNLHLQQW